MAYDSNYQNEQAVSDSFRVHLGHVEQLIHRHFDMTSLIEVGCGKGTFLEILERSGATIRGFDPTYEGNNPGIEKRYFGPDVGLKANGIILRHVLEHIEMPHIFLRSLAAANGGRGLIYIEVPCFDWICDRRSWFDIFYEHVNYFRLSDFNRMFGNVIDAGRLFGGQYLYVVADLSSVRIPNADTADPCAFPPDFTRGIILSSADAMSRKPTVVWGGASKGVIFSLLRERAGKPVDRVVDISPAKQGRYLPGTGIRVQSPEAVIADLKPSSTIFVMNPNYLDEIKSMTDNKYSYVVPGDV